MPTPAHELVDTPFTRWSARNCHRFAHVWPRLCKAWVPDLWIRLPWDSSAGERVAALTFDDGPSAHGTSDLLAALAKWNVRATFFLLGENARRYPERAREIAAAGHAVGNHFRTHINSLRVSRRSIVREVTEGERIVEDVLGLRSAWCRPPYGFLTHTLIKWSRLHRQQVVLWDVFPPDYMPWSRVQDLQSELLRRLRTGSIVCLHDNGPSAGRTPQLLRETLPRLLDQGWRFVTLPEPSWPIACGAEKNASVPCGQGTEASEFSTGL